MCDSYLQAIIELPRSNLVVQAAELHSSTEVNPRLLSSKHRVGNFRELVDSLSYLVSRTVFGSDTRLHKVNKELGEIGDALIPRHVVDVDDEIPESFTNINDISDGTV